MMMERKVWKIIAFKWSIDEWSLSIEAKRRSYRRENVQSLPLAIDNIAAQRRRERKNKPATVFKLINNMFLCNLDIHT